MSDAVSRGVPFESSEEITVTRTKSSGVKMIAAAVGGGALVAMGVFTAVVGGGPTSDGPSSAMGPMTGGATVTEVAATTSTPPASLPIEKAVPSVKAKAYQ